jgi:uncharacterized protein (TIGR02453 family)
MTTEASFPGFPPEAFAFLSDLAQNNRREWFTAHQQEYRAYILEPALAFVAALGPRLQQIAPDLHYDARIDGTGTLTRIHRDTRFSHDKSPYHTALNGLFWEGPGRKTAGPACGFRIEADGMRLMTGIIAFPKPALELYRKAVVDPRLGDELESAIATIQRSGAYTIGGEHYRRVPAGYDPTHPRAQWLRHDRLYATPPAIDAGTAATPAIVDLCAGHFRAMAPLYRWLTAALRPPTSNS